MCNEDKKFKKGSRVVYTYHTPVHMVGECGTVEDAYSSGLVRIVWDRPGNGVSTTPASNIKMALSANLSTAKFKVGDKLVHTATKESVVYEVVALVPDSPTDIVVKWTNLTGVNVMPVMSKYYRLAPTCVWLNIWKNPRGELRSTVYEEEQLASDSVGTGCGYIAIAKKVVLD